VSWRGLRYKGTERLTSAEWNSVVDALNDVYGQLNDGTQDINVNTVNAVTANFQQRITADGKPVILDGDPVGISQFYDTAQEQITEAIDSSNTLGSIEEYTKETRDALVNIKTDQNGNVGVVIADPLDQYGRVLVSAPSELVSELQPVSASGSVAASSNTSGLSVVLNKGGRPNVNVYYSLGGAGTVTLMVSLDGNTWRTLKTYTLSGAGSGIDIVQGVAYPYVMLATSTTGVDVTLEAVASR
jgi:hypothetical protein